MADFKFLIDIPVRNNWGNVGLLRSSVLNCFETFFQDLDGCHVAANVAAELLENAIKYGKWTNEDDLPFRLRVSGSGGRIEVSVENPVDADDPSVKTLFESLKWMSSFETHEEAFHAKLLKVAQERRSPNKSGLGLVRIAYESQCDLQASLDGRMLAVSAFIGIGGQDSAAA